MAKIKDAVLAVTYKCNSRCQMCSIWKKEPTPELSLRAISQLPMGLKDVNISGGEPFLRLDLVHLVQAVARRCQGARIIISSNGFATDLILAKTKEMLMFIPDLGLAISLDGIGQAHDEVRGIPGGYDKVINTIKGLQAIGVRHLKIAFTLADYNYSQLEAVYELSRQLKVEFTLSVVHSSDNFFGQENRIEQAEELAKKLEWLLEQELATSSPKRWARAYFIYGLRCYVRTGQRLLPDYSGQESIFIDPLGSVYPSDVCPEKIGRLSDYGLEINSPSAPCQPSWMICTARTAIRRHWPEVITWIIREKYRRFRLGSVKKQNHESACC
jgi:Fe-coproporphyrin III synthase